MTEDLTDIDGIGPAIAEQLRESGFETADDVMTASADDLVDVHMIGKSSAEAILEGDSEAHGGRPSKFEAVKDDLLEAAEKPLNHEQVANRGGVSKPTLYTYLDEHEEFFNEFKRARGRTADRLIQRGLDPEDEIDISFVRFLLERSFKFIKTERQEVESENTHKIEGDGFVVEFADEV
ncbi:helix-hairpin-helix domain-containing protein [Natronorubrum sp. FCH18a]|uniref:helix-hairpin-helix domain-containing protein n=1 Tax=Natronorubrum sp. FCH18a TaxID=3447018 RepID=UPI003F50DB45